ncbi:MAG: trehalose-6-phosphate synthase [Deltaproteobacteria bacterium]|nr:MAG: trehalose-6-phosphate synthase [Deltaproteobacteria bacterium]
MKITFRLMVSLVIVVAIVTAIFSFYQVNEEKSRMTADLDRRAAILADSLKQSVSSLVGAELPEWLNQLVVKYERLEGVAIFGLDGKIITATPALKPIIPQPFPAVVKTILKNRPIGELMDISGRETYVYILPLKTDDKITGAMALFNDATYIGVRLKEIWKYNLLRFLTYTLLIVLITVVVIRWSITGPIAQIAQWMREARTGKGKVGRPTQIPRGDILAPLINEVTNLAKSLTVARAKADAAARQRFNAASLWTASRLKEQMRVELSGKKLFLVSNREPYMHIKDGYLVRCIVPAGGLVTALDPVMRICDGLWLAHGGGEADREMVDANDKIRVPPEEPEYTLKRVWLSKDEEKGYYYGFSNEGLWPLCHIAHTRPVFRLEDWISYQKVNEKFAENLLQEIAGEESPLVLIQDYHLALLPLLVKEKRPDARVALFWHIPWPNPEAFAICPWQQEILMGMLGADLLGFHIQFHCNNFLDTVDRFLESKTDWEQFSVCRSGHTTLVKPFPISVSFENSRDRETARLENMPLRTQLFREKGVRARYLGVGVDRIDYTKGIPERFRAVERFLEKYPEFIGEFTFVELGAPSRTHIKKYHDFMAEVEETADSINWRFQTGEWKPILFLKAHHSHEEIYPFYKAADVCMVTSLHDGMNLVAKEFVSSRDDGDGVLILSQFTGASRELMDALIINPYDIEEMADALHRSLVMEPQEKSERMGRMRTVIRENNIYRWAGDLIAALARLRPSDSVEGNQ